jgi:hypothetical protein
MAQYGYSAGYQGGGPQAVPSGFIEAYAQAGRNIGAGIQSAANAIGESLQRYGQNKEENQFLTSRLESLAPYLQTVAQSGNIMDKNTPESKLLGDIEKFSSMSIPQKKATLLNAEFFLDRADKAKAREMTDAALAQQLKLGQYNINAIESKLKQDEILSGAIQFGSNQPTTTTQTEQVTDTINFPPIPGRVTPAVMATPSQAEATAARYYMGKYSKAAQDLQRYGTDLEKQANTLNLDPRYTTKPNDNAYKVFGASYQGLGFPTSVPPTTFVNSDYETPIEAAARVEANIRLKNEELAQSSAALQQAGIMSKSPALQTIGPRTLQTAQEAPPIQLPPLTITQNIPTQVPISYEDQSKRLTQYLVQQGAKPETLAMVPQILSMVGQRMPTRVEQVGGIGSVVRFGDKEQFVPAKEANLDNILKVKGLTIDFPEFRGTAPTESEAKDFREQYDTNLKLRGQIVDLLKLTNLGKAQLQTPENKATAQALSRAISATMRKDILGIGVVTDKDQEILDSIIPDPTVLFSWPSANRTKLEGLLSRATSNLNTKAKSIGLESVSLNKSKQPQSSSGRFTIVPGKGIQPIQ